MMYNYAGRIGKSAIDLYRHLTGLIGLFYRVFALLVRHPIEGRALNFWVTIEQIYFTGIQALPTIVPLSLIVGIALMILFSTISSQYDIGKMIIILIVRELGPMITAVIVILRSATAVTIEISYMRIFNEIDAIEMAGIDPMRILAVPRLIGIFVAILSLFVVFDLISIIGGYVVVWTITYIPMRDFLAQIGRALTVSDILVGLIKGTLFSVSISIICLYRGFHAQKHITYIPQVTSKTAVECFFFCVVINILISIIFYL